ncbi:MAG: tRNA (adenosine(37)-N6)-threonylcarbamoyltransferase complex transferase subunit TsaD [Bacteroidota bacterium]
MPTNTQPIPHSIILGIESSCDDTAAAVFENGKILANITATQKVHEQYGGVVPELASRAHQSNIIPVVSEALNKAGKTIQDIDAIAVTQGPGLLGSLQVGFQFAKGLALGANIPFVGVNHLQAHISALFIETPNLQLPMIALLVSGGHTQLVWVESVDSMEIIGTTIDDAAGEAFDKAAKLLGLGYPGGPLIDKYAAQGNAKAYEFPDSQTAPLDFSFSGIKTSLLYFLRKEIDKNPNFVADEMANICASYQHQVVNILMKRLKKAIEKHKPGSIGLAGGVSANSELRKAFILMGEKFKLNSHIPSFEFCTDNAAMIAMAGHFLLNAGIQSTMDAAPFSKNNSHNFQTRTP